MAEKRLGGNCSKCIYGRRVHRDLNEFMRVEFNGGSPGLPWYECMREYWTGNDDCRFIDEATISFPVYRLDCNSDKSR